MSMTPPVDHPVITRLWDEHSAAITKYTEPGRHYHNMDHLNSLVTIIHDMNRTYPDTDLEKMVLAGIYHDAVYIPGGMDNEEKSAEYALRSILDKNTALDVYDIIVALRDNQTYGDRETMIVMDADLSILAGDDEQYRSFSDGIRAEWWHLSDDEYAVERGEVLRRLLSGNIYHLLDREWESRARYNIRWELDSLQ